MYYNKYRTNHTMEGAQARGERQLETSATLFASGKARGKEQEVSRVPCERVRCLRRVASHRSS